MDENIISDGTNIWDNRVTDEQLGTLVVSVSQERGWMANKMGIHAGLSPKGLAEVRRIWEEHPERRAAFAEEPPARWKPSS